MATASTLSKVVLSTEETSNAARWTARELGTLQAAYIFKAFSGTTSQRATERLPLSQQEKLFQQHGLMVFLCTKIYVIYYHSWLKDYFSNKNILTLFVTQIKR